MKNFLLNTKVHKTFLPIALVCILPLWLTLLRKGTPSLPLYIIGGIGFFFFILDRIFKPRELERAEKRRLKTEAQYNAMRNNNTED